MTFDYLYEMLRRHAKSKGSINSQVWHEADIDGYHLYMADTSFGDGPVFHVSGPDRNHSWSSPRDEWLPVTLNTSDEDAKFALNLAARARWQYRLEVLDPVSETE